MASESSGQPPSVIVVLAAAGAGIALSFGDYFVALIGIAAFMAVLWLWGRR